MQGWQPAGVLSRGRVGHAATLLHSGLVLINGGGEGTISANGQLHWELVPTAELYNPDTNEWILTGSPSLPRSHHTATLLRDGNVLVVGGSDSGGTVLADAEIYDFSTQTWSSTRPLHFARSGHAATELADGRVLVVGGGITQAITSAEIYDPRTQAWTDTGPLQQAREGHHTATLLSDGRVLVVGGDGVTTAFLDSIELLDPATETWTLGQRLSYPRSHHTATRLQDGKVLVVGGVKSQWSCVVFHPDSGDWSDVGDLNESRIDHTAALFAQWKCYGSWGVGRGPPAKH
jgi:N-acetylneuraminic acid mutarotase